MSCDTIASELSRQRVFLPAVTGRCFHVLVVDDDPAARRLVGAIVSSAGHRVSESLDGLQALEAVLEQLPDIVICDWEMPGLNGVEFCRRLRQRELAHYVYVVLLTARSNSTDMIAGLHAGADDFVSKPIDQAVLLARIEAGGRILAMEQKLREASRSDPLTGLLNRRAFHERFTQEWERARRYHGFPLSCVMIDIDYFKRINDAHGHAGGDAVIRRVAEVLCDQCRSSDVACRYGGEEFCILLPETTECEAACWADRARLAISRAPVQLEKAAANVTVSLGVAEKMNDTTGPEKLAELADQALMTAKQTGRDRVVRFSSLRDGMIDLPGAAQQFGPLVGVVARDVMSAAVFCPRQFDTVRQTTDFFLQLRVNSAPVIDESGLVVGTISEADLLERTATGRGWSDKIGDVMRTDVVCYEEETPIHVVYHFLCRMSLPRVVVVQRGRPTGVISRATLLRWFRNWTRTRIEQAGEGTAAERECRRAGIVKTAEMAAARAVMLSQSVAGEEGDYVPRVVGEATRLESLVRDLLAQCSRPQVPG